MIRVKKRDIPVEASLIKYQVRIYVDNNHMAWTLTIIFILASENRETEIKTKYAMGMVVERKRSTTTTHLTCLRLKQP